MPNKKQSSEQTNVNVGQQNGGADKEVQAKAYDHAAAQERMAKLREKVKTQKDAERAKENELAKISVSSEDLVMLASAMSCSESVADRRLRERGGDVAAVLRDAIAGKYAHKA